MKRAALSARPARHLKRGAPCSACLAAPLLLAFSALLADESRAAAQGTPVDPPTSATHAKKPQRKRAAEPSVAAQPDQAQEPATDLSGSAGVKPGSGAPAAAKGAPPAAAKQAATGRAAAADDSAPATTPGEEAPAAPSLPDGHQPQVSLRVEPRDGVKTGQLVQLEVRAIARLGDDVTIPDQSFGGFEVHKKQARVEPPQGDKQRFVFNLELLALEPGDAPIPPLELRVVTKDNFVGSVKTEGLPYKVSSLIANEPNAQPKAESKPVAVLEDNYVPVYVLGGLLAVAAIAGLTLLAARWWQKRRLAAVPPPPPRPPWEIAVEKLAELRRRKQAMLEAGQGGVFVDQLSDVVRAYLGASYSFDGLETTTDEMLMQLKAHDASLGFTQEVGLFLGRCDLVKFAKVEPDEDEVDLLFAKAQDLVQFAVEPATGTTPGSAAALSPPRSSAPGLPGADAVPPVSRRASGEPR